MKVINIKVYQVVVNIPETIKSFLFKNKEDAECFKKSISLLYPERNPENREINEYDTKNPFDWDELINSANFKIFFDKYKEEVGRE